MLVYLGCILLVGVPVMMAEVMLGGCQGGMSPINTMRHLVGEAGARPLWNSIGWMGVLVGLLILSYYGVIAGWALNYVVEMASWQLAGCEWQGLCGDVFSPACQSATIAAVPDGV